MANKHEALITEYFKHFNNHDWNKMAEMYTDTAEFKDPSLGTEIVKQKREQVIQRYSNLSEMFPDVSDEVLATYPSGDDHLIVEFVSTGTAPDGSRFKLPVCSIFKIEHGKITKDFSYYDNFGEAEGE